MRVNQGRVLPERARKVCGGKRENDKNNEATR